jgi:hypothetical protein
VRDIKVGDKVIIRKLNVVNVHRRYGIVTKIEYDDYSLSIYYYRVENLKAVDGKQDSFTACNIFPDAGDEIELDLVTMRDDKLNQLCLT